MIKDRAENFFHAAFLLTLLFSFLIVPGCALPPPTPSEDDRLRLPAGSERESAPAKTGQQMASLELTERGRRTLDQGQVDQALSLLQKAISLDPRNPYAYYYLGKARYIKKDYDRILTPLEQARVYFLNERVWLSRVHTLRGQTFEALSRWEEARAEFRKAIEMDRQNPEAREGLNRASGLP